MPVQGLSHYNIRVDRPLMEVLRSFYIEVVGLRAGARPAFGTYGCWLYAGERDVLHLSEQQTPEPRRGSDSTIDHMAFACTDWPDHRSRLERAGVAYTLDHVPTSLRLQVFFRDPAGHGIELLFPPGTAATADLGATP